MNEEIENRAQVGIGTLIVFIALVLVAAIAAGVLINTAGLLQNQAESTGQESTDQVSSGVQITSVTFDTDTSSPPDPTGTLDVTLQLSPGSDPVDIDQTQIEVFGDDSETFEGDGTDFSGSVLSSSEEFETVSLDIDGTPDDQTSDSETLDITAGDQIEIVLTTADGSQTTRVVNVPDPLDPDDTVSA